MRGFSKQRLGNAPNLPNLGRAAGGASDVTAPVISGESYNTTTDTLTLTVSEAVTLYALHNASATPLTAAAIQAGAEVTQAIAAGLGYISWDDSLWGAGTWYLHIAVRDAAGNTAVGTPVQHIIAAPTFTEIWASYVNGDTFTQLDTNYARNSTGLTALIQTEAGAAGGLGCAITTDNNIMRRMDRDDITAALALRTTERVQILAHVEFTTLANSRAGIGYGASGTDFTGAAIWRAGAGWAIGVMEAGDPFNLTNKTDVVTTQTDGDMFRIRIEIDGLDVKVRAWESGSEPGTWTTRTAASAIDIPRLDLVAARLGGANMIVYGYSVGIGADAPAF